MAVHPMGAAVLEAVEAVEVLEAEAHQAFWLPSFRNQHHLNVA